MYENRRRVVLVFAIVACMLFGAGNALAEYNWPTWRGPDANGHTLEAGLPHRWTKDSVTWSTPLNGNGQSSPTIWGRRIFLTTALKVGHERIVICIDRNDGTVLWERIAWSGEPEETHDMNGYASATCATDGQFVYAFFGRGGGLHCYTVDGEHVWSRGLGRFEGPWGTAASPLLIDGMVIQNCDSDKDSYIIALHKQTGEEIWKTKRPDHRGWSSPVLVDAGSRREIVVNGHTGVTAYEPRSGKELWFCAAERGRGSPTVTPANGLLYVANGLSGGATYSVRPGGSGDVTDSHRLWLTRRGGRDLPSPIIVGDYMLLIGLRGAILTCYEAASGKEHWKERLGGQSSASPISYDGLAFFLIETGETVVIEPHSTAKIIATNSVGAAEDELFRASITPSDGQLFLRSDRNLYCVGQRKATAG